MIGFNHPIYNLWVNTALNDVLLNPPSYPRSSNKMSQKKRRKRDRWKGHIHQRGKK